MEQGRNSWRIITSRTFDAKPTCSLKKRFNMKRFFKIKDPGDATEYKCQFTADPDSSHDAHFLF